jgi:hypothetical protein
MAREEGKKGGRTEKSKDEDGEMERWRDGGSKMKWLVLRSFSISGDPVSLSESLCEGAIPSTKQR